MARVISGDGYYMITPPLGHTGKTYIGGRYAYEHRLMFEKSIGRLLGSKEVIDHIDGNKLNNNLSNLQILNPTTHNHKTLLQLKKYGWQNPNAICGWCYKKFHLPPWKIKKRKAVFHNRNCYREFVKRGNWGRNNPA